MWYDKIIHYAQVRDDKILKRVQSFRENINNAVADSQCSLEFNIRKRVSRNLCTNYFQFPEMSNNGKAFIYSFISLHQCGLILLKHLQQLFGVLVTIQAEKVFSVCGQFDTEISPKIECAVHRCSLLHEKQTSKGKKSCKLL